MDPEKLKGQRPSFFARHAVGCVASFVPMFLPRENRTRAQVTGGRKPDVILERQGDKAKYHIRLFVKQCWNRVILDWGLSAVRFSCLCFVGGRLQSWRECEWTRDTFPGPPRRTHDDCEGGTKLQQ